MGSLKDVVVQRETVKTAGGDFTVGPLTAAGILTIYVAHRGGLESIFGAYKQGRMDVSGIFIDLIGGFPEIAAEVIARAAEGDECDEAAVSKARSLDFGAQLMALEAIGTLTVSSAGGLGNLASLVERLAGSLNAAMAPGSLLPDGSTTSASSAPSFSKPGT